MQLQDEEPFHITVSQDFWLMWVIAVPVTVIVVIIWRVWYLDARGRLVDDIRRTNGEHGYMGWKTLPDTLRREIGNEKGKHAATSRGLSSKV
jgi:hypothetical protein